MQFGDFYFDGDKKVIYEAPATGFSYITDGGGYRIYTPDDEPSAPTQIQYTTYDLWSRSVDFMEAMQWAELIFSLSGGAWRYKNQFNEDVYSLIDIRLVNDWAYVPSDYPHTTFIKGNLYPNEASNITFDTTRITRQGVSPFIFYSDAGERSVADAAALAAIEYMSYSDMVTIDLLNGVPGTAYPVGNKQFSVNNLDDAMVLADYYHITKLHFKHHGNVLDNDYDYTGFVLEGEAQATTSLHVDPLPTLTAAVVQNLTFSGTVDGGLAVKDCKVDGVTFFSGSMRECGLTEAPVILGGTGTATFNKCISLVAGGNARPQINFSDEPTNLAIRGWEGGLELVNKTTTEGEVSIDLNSGILYIRSSCTAGEIIVRGIGRLVDESTNGCVVKYDGLIDPAYVQYLTYAEHIWIDETSDNTGTVYPVGTPSKPLNNWADVMALSSILGIHQFMIHGPSTIPATADITGATIMGHHAMSSVVTVADGCTTGNATFKYMTLQGDLSTEAGVVIEDTVVLDLNNFSGYMRRAAITGNIVLGGGRNTTLDMCFRGDRPIGDPPQIDMGGTGQSLGVRGWMGGGLSLLNLDDPTAKISIDMVVGRLDLDASLTQGSIYMRGTGQLNDNGHSLTIMSDDFISRDAISESIWDEFVGDHLIPNTMGHMIYHIEYDDMVILDEANGSAGTTFPTGTKHQPCNNWTDALTILNAHKYSKIKVLGSSTVGAGVDVSGVSIQGITSKESTVTFDPLCINDGVHCSDIGIVGKYSTDFVVSHCMIETGTGFGGTAHNCVINGVLGLAAGETNFYSCYDGIPGVEVAEISIGPCTSLGIWDYQGGLRITDMNTPDTVVSAMITAGRLFVDSTDVEGNIIVKGMANLVGTTGGTTIDSDGLITKDAMQDYIWGYLVEAGLSAEEIMRLQTATLVGKLSGAATGTVRIRDLQDSKDRLTVSVDGQGNRLNVTTDAT